LSILSLILLIPINIANADDQAYDYGFEEVLLPGLRRMTLLKTIVVSQMEKELEGQIKSLEG